MATLYYEHPDTGAWTPLSLNVDHGQLAGREDDDHPQYVMTSGGARSTINGQLRIRGANSIWWQDGNRQIWLPAAGELRVADEGGALAPLQVGSPVNESSAATVGWTRVKDERVMVSGPHGPLTQYMRVDNVIGSQTVWTQCLNHLCRLPGITRVDINGYLQIRNVNSYSRASLSVYAFGYGRWHDGTPFAFTNNNNIHLARLTVTKKAGTTSGDYGYGPAVVSFWFENKPGKRCTLGWAANVDAAYDGTVYAEFGNMRISATVFPYGTYDALDEPAWGTT